MHIERVIADLPEGIDALAAAAEAEGVRNVSMLVSDWTANEQRFDRDGAGLFAIHAGGSLAGIGGVTRESGLGEPAMRMRRFYVHPGWRRCGAGRLLATVAMSHGLSAAPVLTCNAQATTAAPPFWEAVGFVRVDWPNVTHIYRAR